MQEEFNCDMCHTSIDYETDNFYHFSGKLNGKVCNHIHLCDACVVTNRFDKHFIDVKSFTDSSN